MCRPFGVALGVVEAFGLLVVTFFINYVIPFLGFGVRGVYLQKRHGMSLADFGSSLIATLAIELSVYATAGLAAMWLLARSGVSMDPIVALVMAGALAASIAAAAMPIGLLRRLGGMAGKVAEKLDHAQRLLRRPATLVPAVAWTFVQFLAFAACFWLAFRAIHAPIPVEGAVITAALTDFSLLVRLTPAATGTFEGAVYYAVRPFEATLAQAILAALVVRVALAAVFLPLGGLAFIFQVRGLMGPKAGAAESPAPVRSP